MLANTGSPAQQSSHRNAAPTFEARSGSVQIAVWTESREINGDTREVHSIRIQRRYRDDTTGEWRSTNYFRPAELLQLGVLATQVYQRIAVRVTGDESTRRD